MPPRSSTARDPKPARCAAPASQPLVGQNNHKNKHPDKSMENQGHAGIAQSTSQQVPPLNIVQLLCNKDHRWSGVVRDFEHCKELTRQYVSLSDKTGKADVPKSNDFPEDKTAQKELARQLFEAILEVDPSTAGHMHTKRIQNLSNFEVELLAWELLFAIHRAQDSIVGLARWVPESSKNYEKCESFRERFELVKEGCRKSKSVVYGMLLVPFTARMAAAPVRECKLKQSNKKINGKRGVQLKQFNEILAGQNAEHNQGTPESSKRKRDTDGKGSEEEQHLETEVKRRRVESPKTIASVALSPGRVSRDICGTDLAVVVSPVETNADQSFILQQDEGTPRQNIHMDEDNAHESDFLDQWIDFAPADPLSGGCDDSFQERT